MFKVAPSSRAAMRILATAIAGAVWVHAPALALEPAFDSMQSSSGPTASQPTTGGREIMREAERGPSLTQRFGLPQLSRPLFLDLPIEPLFQNGSRLAVPPPLQRPEKALLPSR